NASVISLSEATRIPRRKAMGWLSGLCPGVVYLIKNYKRNVKKSKYGYIL
ncbi:hypothetical protein M2099_001411, partial [Breznakia sp. PFB1-4]|nr:hypothetical protein [Breznakia sp. PFB1-4]